MSALTIGKQLERIGRKGARATMGDLGLVAEALDCPLWVLMVPGISEHPELLDGPGLQRLTRLIRHYIRSSDAKRHDVETVAEAGAICAGVAS